MLLRIEDMLSVKEDILAIHQILSGMFDKEISTINSLKAELEVLAKKADTVKKAEGVKKAADDYAEKIRADVDAYYSEAKQYEEDLKVREGKVLEDRMMVEEKDTEFVTKSNAFAEIVKDQEKKFTSRKKELDAEEERLKSREVELSRWEESLREQNNTLQAKLNLLKGM